MIDQRFCSQIGTERQHSFAAFLASKAGYSRLRDAVSDALKISVSKCSKRIITVKDAGIIIDYLKAKS